MAEFLVLVVNQWLDDYDDYDDESDEDDDEGEDEEESFVNFSSSQMFTAYFVA